MTFCLKKKLTPLYFNLFRKRINCNYGMFLKILIFKYIFFCLPMTKNERSYKRQILFHDCCQLLQNLDGI